MQNKKNLVNWLKRNKFNHEIYKEDTGVQGIIIDLSHGEFLDVATENDDLILINANGSYKEFTNKELYKHIRNLEN